MTNPSGSTMEGHTVTLRDGAVATLYRSSAGDWACPVCGSVELPEPPYYDDGSASFQMCSCGFEYGFDDDPSASRQGEPFVIANWLRWRTRYLEKWRTPEALAKIAAQLKAIGVTVPDNMP